MTDKIHTESTRRALRVNEFLHDNFEYINKEMHEDLRIILAHYCATCVIPENIISILKDKEKAGVIE